MLLDYAGYPAKGSGATKAPLKGGKAEDANAEGEAPPQKSNNGAEYETPACNALLHAGERSHP